MGDRANIIIKCQDNAPIYFYTHWRGRDLPEILQAGLKRGRERWDDRQYLPRILFCKMVQGDEGGNTGFGISTFLGDNEHDFLVVDVVENTVSLVIDRPTSEKDNTWMTEAEARWSFEDYCELDLSHNAWETLGSNH